MMATEEKTKYRYFFVFVSEFKSSNQNIKVKNVEDTGSLRITNEFQT